MANRDKYGAVIDNDRESTPDPEPILNYLDLLARLRGLSNVAGDFQKSLKKAQMPNIEEQAQGESSLCSEKSLLSVLKSTSSTTVNLFYYLVIPFYIVDTQTVK